MLKLCIAGCLGRMGATIIDYAGKTPGIYVASGTVSKVEEELLNSTSYSVSSVQGMSENFDVCIDFTTPNSTLAHLEKLVPINKPVVIGTTGLNKDELDIIGTAAKSIPVVLAPNTSLGINMLYSAINILTKNLPKSWDIHIEETHHIYKKDNPSGSAVKLANIIKNNLNENVSCIGYRKGNVIGDHKITIKGQNETLTLEHHAHDRTLFAEGAILAAQWVSEKPPGVYEMKDVLGLC